jgi:anaphase-promoting complex subunit 8
LCDRLAELNYSLQNVTLDTQDLTDNRLSETCEEGDTYKLAKTYFDLKEYDRAAYFTKDCVTPKARFLHLYSRYLSGEKKKIDDMTDVPPDPTRNDNLKLLCTDLRRDHLASKLDGYGLYLFGVTLKKLQLAKDAVDVLLESIHKEPMHWGAWLELAALVTDREKLESLSLPNHWMKYFFLAHMYLELQLIDEGLALYCELQSMGFQKNGYVLAQTAIAVHYRRGRLYNMLIQYVGSCLCFFFNIGIIYYIEFFISYVISTLVPDVDKAIETFKKIIEEDPYCLDNMDTYSNLLYVKEMKVELAYLAHRATEIDKYRLETCCIVGEC